MEQKMNDGNGCVPSEMSVGYDVNVYLDGCDFLGKSSSANGFSSSSSV